MGEILSTPGRSQQEQPVVLPGLGQWAMKLPAALLPVLAALVLAWSGCAKKADLQTQTAGLEKAFPGLTAAVAAQTEAAAQPAADDPKAVCDCRILGCPP